MEKEQVSCGSGDWLAGDEFGSGVLLQPGLLDLFGAPIGRGDAFFGLGEEINAALLNGAVKGGVVGEEEDHRVGLQPLRQASSMRWRRL